MKLRLPIEKDLLGRGLMSTPFALDFTCNSWQCEHLPSPTPPFRAPRFSGFPGSGMGLGRSSRAPPPAGPRRRSPWRSSPGPPPGGGTRSGCPRRCPPSPRSPPDPSDFSGRGGDPHFGAERKKKKPAISVVNVHLTFWAHKKDALRQAPPKTRYLGCGILLARQGPAERFVFRA